MNNCRLRPASKTNVASEMVSSNRSFSILQIYLFRQMVIVNIIKFCHTRTLFGIIIFPLNVILQSQVMRIREPLDIFQDLQTTFFESLPPYLKGSHQHSLQILSLATFPIQSSSPFTEFQWICCRNVEFNPDASMFFGFCSIVVSLICGHLPLGY